MDLGKKTGSCFRLLDSLFFFGESKETAFESTVSAGCIPQFVCGADAYKLASADNSDPISHFFCNTQLVG